MTSNQTMPVTASKPRLMRQVLPSCAYGLRRLRTRRAAAGYVSRQTVEARFSSLNMRRWSRFIVAVALAVLYAQPADAQDARRQRSPKRVERGSGIILVEVEPKSGRVTGARMLKSTGNRTLDDAAVKRFLKQRFKVGTPRRFQVPISYEMTFDE